jgi:hypothetical protein
MFLPESVFPVVGHGRKTSKLRVINVNSYYEGLFSGTRRLSPKLIFPFGARSGTMPEA